MVFELIFDDFLAQLLSGLIVASIIGAASSFFVLIRCVHKQAEDIKLMKKATIIVLKMIAKDTKRIHGDEHFSDIETVYRELINSNK